MALHGRGCGALRKQSGFRPWLEPVEQDQASSSSSSSSSKFDGQKSSFHLPTCDWCSHLRIFGSLGVSVARSVGRSLSFGLVRPRPTSLTSPTSPTSGQEPELAKTNPTHEMQPDFWLARLAPQRNKPGLVGCERATDIASPWLMSALRSAALICCSLFYASRFG